jgi:hypothetical protein
MNKQAAVVIAFVAAYIVTVISALVITGRGA